MISDSVAQRSIPTAGGLRIDGTLVFLGFSLQLLQVGIIPLLPLIGADFKLSTASVSWLVTSSLLAGILFLAIFSRLADIVGKVLVIKISLGLVLIGSLIGCFADSYVGLLIARILMGAVLPMLALPEAVASDTMKRDRASVAIAAIHGGTGTGIGGGFILGGLAGAGDASWRWFFIVGAITSAIGILASWAWLRDADGGARARGRLDVVGAGLLAVGLGAVLLGVSEGPSWGWASVRVWGLGIVGLIVMCLWWVQQRRVGDPLIGTEALISEQIRLPLAMTLLGAVGIYSAYTALSRFALSDYHSIGYGYGWKPLQIGWYAIPQALGCSIGFFAIRALVRRNRPAQALAVGFATITVAFFFFGVLTTHPFFTLLALGLDSLGLAMILALTQIVMVRSVPASQSGVVLGLAVIVYTLGNAIGSAVVAVFFQSFGSSPEAPSLHAFRIAYLFGGVAAIGALLLCVPLWLRLRGGWGSTTEQTASALPR